MVPYNPHWKTCPMAHRKGSLRGRGQEEERAPPPPKRSKKTQNLRRPRQLLRQYELRMLELVKEWNATVNAYHAVHARSHIGFGQTTLHGKRGRRGTSRSRPCRSVDTGCCCSKVLKGKSSAKIPRPRKAGVGAGL